VAAKQSRQIKASCPRQQNSDVCLPACPLALLICRVELPDSGSVAAARMACGLHFSEPERSLTVADSSSKSPVRAKCRRSSTWSSGRMVELPEAMSGMGTNSDKVKIVFLREVALLRDYGCERFPYDVIGVFKGRLLEWIIT